MELKRFLIDKEDILFGRNKRSNYNSIFYKPSPFNLNLKIK